MQDGVVAPDCVTVEADGRAIVAADGAETSRLAVRWFHAGTVPSRGKVRLADATTCVPRAWVEALLESEGEDLRRYGAWVHSPTFDGYVKLEDIDELTPTAYDGSGRMLLVRLEERPARTARTALELGRGFFGIGIVRGKAEANHGTLWRSAVQLGAAFVFTVGARYEGRGSDTADATKRIPCLCATDWDDFAKLRPHGALLVGVELGGTPLDSFEHPDRCVYVLGAEDHGLPRHVREACHHVITIPATRHDSFNVAVAGSLVMYDRMRKRGESVDALSPDQTAIKLP